MLFYINKILPSQQKYFSTILKKKAFYFLKIEILQFLTPFIKNVIFIFRYFLNPKCLFLGSPFEPYKKIYSLKNLSSHKIKNIGLSYKADIIFIPNKKKRLKNNLYNKYFSHTSFPDMEIKTNYSNFDKYLENISSNNKSSIKRNIKKFNKLNYKLYLFKKKQYTNKIYNAYKHINHKSKISWITYSKHYFKQKIQSKRYKVIIALNKQKKFLGFATFFQKKKILYGEKIGINPLYDKKGAILFRLFYNLIEYSINNKINKLKLKPTNYNFKKHLGAKQKKLYNIIIPISPFWINISPFYKSIYFTIFKYLKNFKILKKFY